MLALIVGTGSIGRRHMTNLRNLVPTVRFVALREGIRNQHKHDISGVVVTSTLDEAIKQQPDLMIIANPSALHFKYIELAINNEIPFYIEKPVVTHNEDLNKLKNLLSKKNVPTNIVGCNLRFLPSLKKLKSLLDDGKLGRLVRSSFEAGQWLPDWRPTQDYKKSYSAKKSLGGGVTLDLIHEIDAAHWIMGDFEQVSAQLWKGSNLDIETEDCACLLMKSKAGPLAVIQVDYVSRQPFRRYRLVGDLATAEWDLPSKSLSIFSKSHTEIIKMDDSDFDVSSTYINAMNELIDAIANNKSTSQPIEDGILSLETVLHAKKAFNAQI